MAKFIDPWAYTAEDMLKHYRKLDTRKDLDPLLERVGDARYVLLGEASHGTHEYYTWRAHITKRLIEEKGFSFVAVEGDWPDCYQINRFIKGLDKEAKDAKDVLSRFHRWPTWMWANWEIAAFSEWLKLHNENSKEGKKVGFFGLDVYSLWDSMSVVVDYLEKEDPETAVIARKAMECFEPFENEGQSYARALYSAMANCQDEVVRLLYQVRANAPHYDGDPEAGLNAEVNSLVARNAEKYYRSMVGFGEDSWNVRDRHMVETLNKLMDHHGPESKVIVWEHNTHVGDARATDMARSGLLNVGQLVREQHEKNGVYIVGFGSYEGTVTAARSWGAKMETMAVPAAKLDSFEEILHRESAENKLLLFDNPALRERFATWLGHRAIGVVYHPERERGNYVPTVLPERYDAFLYIDKTRALHPLHLKPDGHLVPETYPFGF
jgi:erythromycin esterase